MAERDPMKALAEQPAWMRRRAVIVPRQRPPTLLLYTDVFQIAALRGVTGKRPLFHGHLVGRKLETPVALTAIRELVRAHPAAGQIIGGEVVDRQEIAKLRGQRVSGIVI